MFLKCSFSDAGVHTGFLAYRGTSFLIEIILSMNIMIVDDHADMRRMLRNLVCVFKGASTRITECETGEQAVAQYELLKPDCVLMDIELGTMSGFEATKKINQLDSAANVVIVTSHDNHIFRTKSEELKVKGYVTKDKLFDLALILNTINS